MSVELRRAHWGDVVALMPRAPSGVVIGMKSQMEAGPAFVLLRDGAPVMVAGLVPIVGGGAGAWFLPGAGAARSMAPMVRLARLTLAALPYRPVIVQVESEAGRRIARAIGFQPGGRYGAHEVMTYEPNRQDFQRRQQQRGKGPGGETVAHGDCSGGATDRAG